MLILASTSPRRKEILNFFSLKFKVIPSNFDETEVKFVKDAKSYVLEIAEKKALALDERFFNDIIISADTIVYAHNKIYTKPNNAEDAKRILEELSNSWHEILTAVCIKHKNRIYKDVEKTKVLFHDLDEIKIKKYHNAIYFSDKAGGYAIQKAGSIIIKKMIGCYYNAMGMPINTLNKLLMKAGIDLWDYLKPF
ncbi:MAG: nucleoside triphosphate pyrophosphatase [Parachlamydiales bacterium]|jgi:septum formation protein